MKAFVYSPFTQNKVKYVDLEVEKNNHYYIKNNIHFMRNANLVTNTNKKGLGTHS